jgi:hypothetical protein
LRKLSDMDSSLSRSDREAILQEVCRLVETKHFNPKLNGVDWDSVVEARRNLRRKCMSLFRN